MIEFHSLWLPIYNRHNAVDTTLIATLALLTPPARNTITFLYVTVVSLSRGREFGLFLLRMIALVLDVKRDVTNVGDESSSH